MSIKPVFLFLIKVRAHKLRFFIPFPIWTLNEVISDLADLVYIINIITFGQLKAPDKNGGFSFRTVPQLLYVISDFFTELTLFTGRFDLVDVSAKDSTEKVSVKISTF